MSPLERRGWMAAASDLLVRDGRGRPHAAGLILVALVEAEGRAVSVSHLRHVAGQRAHGDRFAGEPITKRCLFVHVSRLRDALRDVGLGGFIETLPEGYRVSREGAALIDDAVRIAA